MKLTGKTCYSHLLWLSTRGPLLEQSIYSIKFNSPCFTLEGIAGYIETSYEIEVKDLNIFTRLWMGYYGLSNTQRLNLYGLAKGLGDCK